MQVPATNLNLRQLGTKINFTYIGNLKKKKREAHLKMNFRKTSSTDKAIYLSLCTDDGYDSVTYLFIKFFN